MDNENIHDGLDKKEIRDYLAKTKHKENLAGHFSNVEYLEKEMEDLKRRIEHAKTVRAVCDIIKSIGWKEFDISGIVPYKSETYFVFIGTDEEYAKLVERAKAEESKVKDE